MKSVPGRRRRRRRRRGRGRGRGRERRRRRRMSIQEVARGESGPKKGSEHGGNFNIYMGHKIQKLDEQGGKAEVEDKISNIFCGKIVFVNGKCSHFTFFGFHWI